MLIITNSFIVECNINVITKIKIPNSIKIVNVDKFVVVSESNTKIILNKRIKRSNKKKIKRLV